jgi:hypothetical protein
MADYDIKVIKWIENNYDTTTLDILDYHLPSSKVLKLRNGKKRIVYWDYIKGEIVEKEF